MAHLFSPDQLNIFYNQILLYLPRIAGAVVIFIVFFLIYFLTKRPIEGILRRSRLQESLVKILVHSLYKILLIVIALVMASGQLGLNISAALAGLGVIGLALGFAAQDSLSNIIAGFIIFFDKPFKVGDWITVAEENGRVELITIRSTRIRTRQNRYVVIPNQKIVNDVLVDHSTNGEVRVDIPIGIAYKESIDEARGVLLKVAEEIDEVLKKPKPDVVVDSLGASSVNLLFRVWVEDATEEKIVFYNVIEASKKALDAAKIEIPFPHLQLFVDDIKDEVINKII